MTDQLEIDAPGRVAQLTDSKPGSSQTRHMVAGAVFAVATFFVLLPMFGSGSPPGVDAPTFLHLAWVVEQVVRGQLESPFTDPYWYGGYSYLQAYPPLAYGPVGLLAAVLPMDVEIAYRAILFLAFAGLGVAVYALALEYGMHGYTAIWSGLLTLLSYPALVAVGIFGWFPTVVALPLGIAGLVVLERALRRGSLRLATLSGALFAGALLAHHMTGFALALVLMPWAVYRLVTGPASWRLTMRILLTTAGTTAVLTGPWLLWFATLILGVGFEREVPGIWHFGVEDFRQSILDRSLIGREVYPLYLGLVQVPLAIAGATYAVFARSRAAAGVPVLLAMIWFAAGPSANPLIAIYPFSGLDTARFAFYLVPFAALYAALFFEAVAALVIPLLRHQRHARWLGPLAWTVAAGLLLAVPILDVLSAHRVLRPVSPTPEAEAAFAWLRERTPQNATVLTVGFRNWDAWWVPERTGRRVMDGWNDEGAIAWRQIREVRMMGWTGQVDTERLRAIMSERGVDYLVVHDWWPFDSPREFERRVREHPALFVERAAWPGLTVYELRSPGGVAAP